LANNRRSVLATPSLYLDRCVTWAAATAECATVNSSYLSSAVARRPHRISCIDQRGARDPSHVTANGTVAIIYLQVAKKVSHYQMIKKSY